MTAVNWGAIATLNNVANWLVHAGKQVYLQDANAFLARRHERFDILTHLKTSIPSIGAVTTYAQSTTCSQQSLEELQSLKESGLTWLFVGIESGCTDLLTFMKKRCYALSTH
jgi:hypothetical protein